MKRVQNGRQLFDKYKSVICALVYIAKLFPLKFKKSLLVLFRGKKGTVGIVLRYIFLKSILPDMGDNVVVYEDVYLKNPEHMHIGNNVSIHPMSYIEAIGGLRIGDDVSIAHAVTIMTVSHQYQNPEVPIKYQGFDRGEVIIQDNVWIGAKATLLCGVTIEEGSIVGAAALVNKSVSSNSIVGGIPAKFIKKRV